MFRVLCCQQARKRITASINHACCMVNASPYLTGTSVSVLLATLATTARLTMVRLEPECVQQLGLYLVHLIMNYCLTTRKSNIN